MIRDKPTNFRINQTWDKETNKPVKIPCQRCKNGIGYGKRIYEPRICKDCAYKASGYKLATASTSFQIHVDCPYCKHYFDILEAESGEDSNITMADGFDGVRAAQGFEYEVTCPECEKEFLIDEVEY